MGWAKNIFEKIMSEMFSNLAKDIQLQIQEMRKPKTGQIQKKINIETSQFQKTSTEEKTLEAMR